MEKTIVKYVAGLSENASAWERKNHKRYGSLANVCRQIDYDIKHGVTSEQVVSLLQKIRDDSSYASLRKGEGALQRLDEIEKYFASPKVKSWF